MNGPALRTQLRAYAPWLALPLVAAAAYGIGVATGDGGEHAGAPEARDGKEPSDGSKGSEETVWTCSMHPQVRSSEPGQCPICGMDLIPASSTTSDDDEDDPKRIAMSERAKVLARIRTTRVERASAPASERRLLGRVVHDETRLQNVTAWVGGRIDRLHVEVTGTRVRRGQVVASLYSPDVYSAHRDLIEAVKQRRRFEDEAAGPGLQAADAAIRSARTRLRLVGIPERELDRMEAADAPWENVSIRSPYSGTIIERVATEGQYVDAGSVLYRTGGLDRLWVQLDAYERDLPYLEEGQAVRLEVEALPKEPFEGHVAFIDPVLDDERRTAQVRVEVDNPEGKLKPGMFAEATVQAKEISGSTLVIPRSAPLFTGRRSVVYVEVPQTTRPTYELREVRLGPRAGDTYPILAGLSEGERVVSHGAFVLDADQQIRGGVSMMSLDDDASAYDDRVELTSEEREQLARVVERYLAVQSALASDEAETAKTQAKALDRVGREVELSSEGAPEAWERVRAPLLEHTATLAEASSLDAMRKAFAAASEAVERLLATFGNPLREALHVAYCPMAFDDEGAEWVQRGETIDNSYFGPAMQSCGELRRTAHPGAGFGSEAPGEGSSPPGQEDSRGGDAQGGHDRGADSQGAHSHEGHAH